MPYGAKVTTNIELTIATDVDTGKTLNLGASAVIDSSGIGGQIAVPTSGYIHTFDATGLTLIIQGEWVNDFSRSINVIRAGISPDAVSGSNAADLIITGLSYTFVVEDPVIGGW